MRITLGATVVYKYYERGTVSVPGGDNYTRTGVGLIDNVCDNIVEK
jgi:hypothetical protein